MHHTWHVSAHGALDVSGRDMSGNGLAAVHRHARYGEDGTTEGRDSWTGYQEKSRGEVLCDCMSIHTAGARQGNPTLWFSLPGTVKIRCLEDGSTGGC